MVFFDSNPQVISWASEEKEITIPYICGTDGKRHLYYLDFLCEYNSKKDDLIKTIAIEVKPEKQTVPPKKSKKKTKRYLTEVLTWVKNESKWKYAKEFCNARGWEFEIWTEKTIDNICGKAKKTPK